MVLTSSARGSSQLRARYVIIVFALVALLIIVNALVAGPSRSSPSDLSLFRTLPRGRQNGDVDDGERSAHKDSLISPDDVVGGENGAGKVARKGKDEEEESGRKGVSTLPAVDASGSMPTLPAGRTSTISFPSFLLSECVPTPHVSAITARVVPTTERHRPRHIQKELDDIATHGLERYLLMAPKDGPNSLAITEEDITRAKDHWIEALQEAPIESDPRLSCGRIQKVGGNLAGGEPQEKSLFGGNEQNGADLENLALSAMIYNQLKDTVQSKIIDGSPMVVDIGCVLGETFARMHPSASVLCVHLGREFSTKVPHNEVSPNLFHLFAPVKYRRGGHSENDRSFDMLLEGEFKRFFEMCNFFTLVFVLGNARKDLSRPTDDLLALLEKLLPMSALLYVAVPTKDATLFGAQHFIAPPLREKTPEEKEAERLQAIEDLVRKPEKERQKQRDREAAAAKRPPAPTRIDSLTETNVAMLTLRQNEGLTRRDQGMVVIKEYVLGKSSRPCRKTWNAPFVQWYRSQSVSYEEGKVSFLVKKAAKKGKDGDAGGPGGEGGLAVDPKQDGEKLRFIHPLQYLPSINLDTLLGAGLSDPVRIRLLGEMIATPRYSDPLPHNWVLTRGHLERIDKVDLAYDAKVDEKLGYWGRSTRGYLRLLTEHLCLPVNPDGSPSPFLRLEGEACTDACRTCVDACSYLPKGTICTECKKCGEECVKPMGLQLQSAAMWRDPAFFAKVSMCQKTYSSMHAARKIWSKWERSDNAALSRTQN